MRRALFASFLLGGLAAAMPASADDGVRLGETYRGVVQLKTYGSPQVPLPPGDWKLVGLTESRSDTTNIRILQGALVQVRSGVMAGRVIFTVPDSPSRGGWGRPSICDRKNILANFSAPAANSGGYDCLTLDAVSMIRSPNADKLGAQFYDYLDANQIKKPNAALSTAFNYSDGRSYLIVSYLFNPDVEKITPAASTSWHVDRYKDDPKRAAYVERIKSWAQELRPKLADGLKGRLSPDYAMASPAPLPSAVPPPTVNVSTASGKPAMAGAVPSPQIGKTYRDSLQLDTVGAPQIALPPGDWKLVVLGQGQSDIEKQRLVRGYLIQTKGDAIAARVYFNVSDGLSTVGWAPSDNCTRKDPIADLSANRGGGGKPYDCSAITAYSMARPKSGGPQLMQFHDYLDANGIKRPAAMINVGFGLSNGKSFVTAEYMFNPELEGVRAETISAWQPARFGEDSHRGAYIEKMKAWAAQWHPKVEAGFKAALPKTAAIN